MEHEKTAQADVLTRAMSESSLSDVDFLIVVASTETDLYEHLTKIFADVRGIKVILERRQGDRRRQSQDMAVERRQRERRLQRGKVSALGYTAVNFHPQTHRP